MKAGDIVYESRMPETRGELIEFLCDAIEEILGVCDSDRSSNGQVADTLFRFLDMVVVSEVQVAALRAFIDAET